MERYQIERLRALPIEEVARRLGLTVEHHKCLCCFHNDHSPSMSFNVKRNTFRCWSCGAHGGVIDLAMHVLNRNFVETCAWLADGEVLLVRQYKPPENRKDAGRFDASRYARCFEHPWLNEAAQRFLFGERHLDRRVVEFCRLNSYGDWLQIPYYDVNRKLIGLQRRYMGNDPKQPRFRFQQGEECHLYNLPVLPMLGVGEPLYLGEGPSDVWALLSSGRKAIGIPSATLLKEGDLTLLEPLRLLKTPLHIYPDNDSAGDTLYEKLLVFANRLGLCLYRHELPEGCKDFSDYWKSVTVTRNS